jgi:hypothetical protein
MEALMNRKKYIYGMILGLTLTSVTACSPKIDNSNAAKPDTNQESVVDENQTSKVNIMDEYNKLIADDNVSLKEIVRYMNENIKNATGEEASTMIIGFEELQLSKKSTEDEKYLSEEIQKGFQTLALEGIDINQTDAIKDETIMKLVAGSQEAGYKIETAEGFFFPIIDYSFYKQFSSYATPEIKDYIDIMTVESDNVFAKDAALVISWDEVVNRTLAMEKYINNYTDSKKRDYIKSFYDNYVFITMHGLNNTSLFDYESKQMDEKAKSAFTNALAQSIDSEYLNKLGEFMKLAEKSDYKLSDRIETYRKENTDNGSNESNESNEVVKNSERYDVAGIDDADEFDKTFELLRTALVNNDMATFADYIAYPIKVNLDGNKVEIKDKNEFIKNFDKIMNDDIKNKFIEQRPEEFFVNQYGVSIGDGEFWLSQIEGQSHKFSIYAINN